MTRISLLFTVCFTILFSTLMAQTKVVGYLPSYRFGLYNQIEYDKLTHLVLCFANPNASGDLLMENSGSVTNIVAKAKEDNPTIKTMISIAGGTLSAQIETNYRTLMMPANRAGFINKICNYLKTNNYDGIDVDLEGHMIDANYPGFIIQLSDSLDKYGFILSAALAKYNGNEVPATALNKFHFINMMAYDEKGPWQPYDADQHSSLEFAQADIDYWNVTRGVPANKLVLGLPFYGYDFSNPETGVVARTFGWIVQNYPNAINDNSIGQLYYNGKALIQEKTQLAMDLGLAGVMVWELGQDSFTENSLLTALNQIVLNTEDAVFVDSKPSLYPNPVSDMLYIELPAGVEANKVSLFTIDGLAVGTYPFGKLNDRTYSISLDQSIGSGMYMLYVIDDVSGYSQASLVQVVR